MYLKNAPLWNFLRHQCLKCAHMSTMSTIALTIRHTGQISQKKILEFVLKSMSHLNSVRDFEKKKSNQLLQFAQI